MKLNKITIRIFLIVILTLGINQFSFAQKEDFDQFLNKFCLDSTYQLERVVFPLKKIFVNDETFELDSMLVLKQYYKINKFHYNLYNKTDAYPIVYDNFECKLRDSDERVFRWKGFTDMDERYYFKRLNKKWYLIRVEILGL